MVFYFYLYQRSFIISVKESDVAELKFLPSLQGSHRSGKSGKILKTFSSQGNQVKTGVSAKIRENCSNQGNFFQTF